MRDLKRVVAEEAIRSMAILGILVFTVVPGLVALGVRSPWGLIVPAMIGLVSFPIGVWLRIRSGMRPLVITRRVWYLALLSGILVFLLGGVLLLLTGAESLAALAVQLLVVVVLASLLAWRPPRRFVRR